VDLPEVLVLEPSERAPALAREHTRRIGQSWPTDYLDMVLLVVSEAVTNAVRYGEGRVELSIRVTSDRVRIEVSDANPDPPVRRGRYDGLADGGRGLHLLDALTDAWGTHPLGVGSGKVVWLQLGTPR
jgi:anti-sigma regulatory factor (Ser/Thr protein kinase)